MVCDGAVVEEAHPSGRPLVFCEEALHNAEAVPDLFLFLSLFHAFPAYIHLLWQSIVLHLYDKYITF